MTRYHLVALARTLVRLNVLVWFLLAVVLTPIGAAAIGFGIVAWRRHKVGMSAVRAVPETSRFDIWDGWTDLGFDIWDGWTDLGFTTEEPIPSLAELIPDLNAAVADSLIHRSGANIHASIAALTTPGVNQAAGVWPWTPETYLDGSRIDESARWRG